MLRRTTILLVGAAGLGVGLLGISSSFAAPASGAVIGDVASAGAVTQKVLWRGRAVGFRGVGLRGVGWRGVGWRGAGWRGGWGWRPGLAVAGLAAAGLATAGYNYGYGYPYGYYGDGYYGAGPYAANYGYGYGYGYQPYGYGYQTAGYGYQPAGFGYQPAAAFGAPAAPTTAAVAPANPNSASANEPTRSRVRHRQANMGATAAGTRPVPNQRWTRGFCVNAVHERLGISSSDAGKPTNKDAVTRCLTRGPMAIG